jgi:CheY-like chemotaxis protein
MDMTEAPIYRVPEAQTGSSVINPGQPSKARVLVVEDEPQILRIVCWQLRSFGYAVTEARSATEALQFLSEEGSGFDLLFTDVVLPEELNGIALARWARGACGSSLKVLLTSGYLLEEIVRQFGPLDEGMPLLPKPYTLDTLAAALRSLLGSRA